MSDTLGNKLKMTIFGASHAPEIGVILSNLPKGMKVDYDFINFQLAKRRPNGKESTARIEDDEFEIQSGVTNGYTNGDDLKLVIKNKKQDSSAYSNIIYRPGHADYTQDIKYHGQADSRRRKRRYRVWSQFPQHFFHPASGKPLFHGGYYELD